MSKLMKIREVAAELGVSYGTVRAAIDKGKLRAYRFEGTFRVEPVDLAAYRDVCKTEPPEPGAKLPARGPSAFNELDGAQMLASWQAQGVKIPGA